MVGGVPEVPLARAARFSDNPGFDFYGPRGAIALCILTGEDGDRLREADDVGIRPCAEVAHHIFNYFDPRAEAWPPATR